MTDDTWRRFVMKNADNADAIAQTILETIRPKE
jgi:hypothetical protein